MAITFVSDKDLAGTDDRKAERFIKTAWFTDEFKEALAANAGQWGLMNEGKLVDRSYFRTKLRKQAVAASAELGGKVVLRFEYVEQEPDKNYVIQSGAKKGEITTKYFDQGKVWAKLVAGEAYGGEIGLAEVWNKDSKGNLSITDEAAPAPVKAPKAKAAK